METTFFDNIDFNLPKNQSNVIKVIGVGGGGSNAVNHMYKKGIYGIDFVICNTDAQALTNSPVPIKIQLGASLTEGLGAGANPEVGERSAIESADQINAMFGEKTKMVFITVGMGGGTGTGAAPVIAKMARERNLLTVAIVTTPFSFEGLIRNEQAQKGIDKLRENVDSIIVINNNKLREVYGNLGFKSGFSKADEVLSTAAMGITKVITHHYTQNIDFKDANTVLANSGSAIMGSAKATGANRSQEAINKALESPLLNDNKITGAKNVLLLIVSGKSEITIDEIGEINDYIQSEAKGNVNIIMGVGEDEDLGESIAVTIVATGFDKEQQTEISKIESKKIIYNLDDSSAKLETTFIPKSKVSNKKGVIDKPEIVQDKIVHQLLEDESKTSGQISLFDIEVEDVEFIHKKSVEVEDEENKGFFNSDFKDAISVIKNNIIEEEQVVLKTSNFNEDQLITTTEIIKNIDIVYDEVLANEKEFIITSAIADIEVIDHEVVVATIKEENQVEIAFNLPIDAKPTIAETEITTIKNDLDEAKQIDVIDTEIVSKNKVYSLEDYIEIENRLVDAKPEVTEILEVDEELKLKTKTIELTNEEIVSPKKEISPLNSTISELRMRADDRRQKMAAYNYKFANKTKQNIDELEKQPAYKRNNINLDEDVINENNQSRISLDIDGKDINFRSNNSFLHDNVD